VFLTKENVAKLGDMNVSKVAKKGLCETQTGTPYYASPEVWKDQAYDGKSDIWSLGCVIYEMITLKPPFRAEDMEGLYKKVIRGSYSRIPTQYSQDLSNLIRALLQTDPNIRPSCDKILAMPSVIKHSSETTMVEPDEGVPELLRTIKVPKNIHYLTEKLPKPNYIPLKYRRSNLGVKSLASSLEREPSDPNNDSSIATKLGAEIPTLPYINKSKKSKDEVVEQLLKKQRKERLDMLDKLNSKSRSDQNRLEVEGHHYNNRESHPKEARYILLPRIRGSSGVHHESLAKANEIRQAYNHYHPSRKY
jgi:serine/threonine protein kinase